VCITGLVSNIVGYLVPRDQININAFPYASFAWEKDGDVYRSIRVNKWKKKLPDMSKHLAFLYPKQLTFHPTSEQVERLIKESCVAEFVHIMLIAAGPLISCFIDGFWGDAFTFMYMLGNMPFVIIQRYNRPTLKTLYIQLMERESKLRESGGKKRESADIVM